MKVDDLQLFINSLIQPLGASGAKQVANELQQVCTGLEPFKDMAVGQFAAFLRQAEAYRRTGIVPAAGKSREKTKAVDRDNIQTIAQRVLTLYEQATETGVGYTAIDGEIKTLDRSLNKDEAIEVAREVGIVGALKTKKDALAGIRKKIAERKESFQRTQF